MVIAGDLYDGSWKDFNTGIHFAGQMGRLHAAGMGTDYLALVDGATLEPLAAVPGVRSPTGEAGGREAAAQPATARLLAAMRLGSVRLLDNWPVA